MTRRLARIALLAAAVALGAVALAACAEQTPAASTAPPTTNPQPTTSPSTTTSPTTTVAARPLPPHEKDDLVEILGPIAAPLGYEVSRAALIDRDTYEVTPDGGHLAIYLAPTADLTFDQFAADLPVISAAFLPFVFDAWPELESFDVCQEPFGSDQETPPSLTIVDLTREASASVDWGSIDLPSLIAAGDSVDGLSVWARNAVRESATWQEAAGG